MRVIIEVGPGYTGSGNHQAVHHEYRATYASKAKKVPEEEGRACWTALHTCTNPSEEWLTTWEETIPRYNCGGGCKKFYLTWKADNPPRFDDFFAWSVELHNAVNRKLDKPEVTLQEAIKLWKNEPNQSN